MKKGKTLILVSLSVFLIFTLDKGEIIAEGKHEELIENSSRYKDIILSQLSA
ncbi:hypothetical protein [Thermoanaerobacter thermocopriae]|uniref:hypothetical protein n=1 Tax=Thermoanaerobacter thermocopriae TaxID=29350 RepID=UPI0004BC57BA|nr:hypothetical protein [Thermoanaerobacter thermocopriae]